MRPFIVLILLSVPLQAAPFISYRGIVNAASFAPPGLPNGSLARGSIFSIFGRELGPANGAVAGAFPLGASLEGVSVEVCQGGQCLAAIPLFAAGGQINAIMPSNAPLGAVSIRARVDGEAGNFSPARVVESSVGIFAVNSGGFGPGIVQNFVSNAERPLNSASAPARRGQVVTIWGTGLGAALNGIDNEPPQVGDFPVAVEVYIGGRRVTNKLYSGRSPQFPGLDQINVEVPADTPLGCYAPVQVRTAGAVVSNTVTLAISSDGSRCSDADSPFEGLVRAGRFGVMFLQRSDRLMDRPYGPADNVVGDTLIATFRVDAASDFYFNPVFSPSPPGSCLVFGVRGDPFDRETLPGTRPISELDAGGSLTVTTPDGNRLALRQGTGGQASYSGFLGGSIPGDGAVDEPVFDGPGPFTVTGAGGAEVGPFEVSVSPGSRVRWTNREGTNAVDRATGVTLEFAGGDPGLRMLSAWGGGYDRARNASTMFACMIDPASESFTVPPEVLANVPPGSPLPHGSKGWLGLAYADAPGHASFEADGISGGVAIFSGVSAKTVVYR